MRRHYGVGVQLILGVNICQLFLITWEFQVSWPTSCARDYDENNFDRKSNIAIGILKLSRFIATLWAVTSVAEPPTITSKKKDSVYVCDSWMTGRSLTTALFDFIFGRCRVQLSKAFLFGFTSSPDTDAPSLVMARRETHWEIFKSKRLLVYCLSL